MPRKKKSTGPNRITVLLVGFLTFFLGAVLGCLSLVSMPVTVVSKPPESGDIKPGEVYFVKGTRSGRTAWLGKEQAWRDGRITRLMVNEAELNQWSEERLDKPSPERDEETGSDWLEMVELTVEPANFRLVDDRVQLATYLSLPGLLPNSRFLYQVRGTLSVQDGTLTFSPEESTLGKAPVGSVPVLGGLVHAFILRKFRDREDLDWVAETMGNIQEVAVADGRMILNRGNRG